MKMQARRGGLWLFRNAQRGARSAYRSLERPSGTNEYTGFRVVCLPREARPTQVAIRGGSHVRLNYPWCRSTWCRSACRGVCHSPDYADDDIGFRVICLPPS